MNQDVHRQQRAVLARFTQQADQWGNMPVTDELREILARIEVHSQDRILDVAAGSALLSRALAARAKEVVAVDLTRAMLESGRRAAQREGISNIRFVEGAAESLPFADGEFDLAITRFSLHHIAEPQCAVDEMVRVTRGRGRVAIIDLFVSDDPQLARRTNDLERRRDASHARTLSWLELQAVLENSGATIVDAWTVDRVRDLEDWLDLSSDTDRGTLKKVFLDELAGGQSTGLQPFRDGDAIRFHHPLGVLVARA
jgi:SAM-dependent methyltransferase